MSKLACNIAVYRPNPDMLAANFRHWHVEALLSQAATLIDRCLEDYREYSYLDYAWNEFQLDLETQGKKLGLDKKRGLIDRELVTTEHQVSDQSQGSLVESETEMLARSVDLSQEPEPARETADASSYKSSFELRAEAFERKRKLAAPGGPFALDERRDLALKRLCRDYEEAVNRACVAEEGLKRIYDHVGVPSPLSSEAEPLGASITNLAIWIRDCTEWLARYRQLEHAFTRAVSLRALLNRNAWTQLKQARDSFFVKFQVPVELFRGYDNCHLRGLGASLIGEAGKVPWSMTLRLPDEAVYERSGFTVELDQSRRDSCLLGRVENRRQVHTPEFCGALSLRDASPIGRKNAGGLWSLELFKPIGAASETFGHVEDVVIEMSIVGTPQKTLY